MSSKIEVTIGNHVEGAIPAERIPLPYPDLSARGEACMGKTRDGDIWAAVGFNTGRPGSGPQTKPERLFHSADGGLTWTGQTLEPTGSGRMCAFTVLEDDTFLLAVAGGDRLLGREVKVYRSSDRGATWEPPATIKADPYDLIGGGFVSMTQIASGVVLLPITVRTLDGAGDTEGEGGGQRWNMVFRSIDGGRTWGDPCLNFDFVSEPHIIQLRSGGLLGAFRHQRQVLTDDPPGFAEKWGAHPGRPAPRAPARRASVFKRVFVGDSDDGGRTWSGLRPLTTSDEAPLLEFGECHGQLVQLPDDRVVLVHDRRYPYDQSEIRARVSQDEGRTWGPELYHVASGMGYPASVALQDGTIVTVTGVTRMDARANPIEGWMAQAIRWRPPA